MRSIDDSAENHSGSKQQLSWLEQEVKHAIDEYRQRRRRDKRKSFTLRLGTVGLSAAITVLLGIRVGGEVQQQLANIALALGAMITVLAAADAFFAHRTLWINRTETVRMLEALDRQLAFYKTGLDNGLPEPTEVEGLFSKLDSILAEDQRAWLRARQASDPSPSSHVEDELY
jgi:hypothetical protein